MSGAMQWTGTGLVPATGIVPNAGVEKPGAVFQTEGLVQTDEVAPRAQPAQFRQPKKAPPSKPVNVLSLAKARLREVKKELRRMKTLDKERLELERLIAAAEGKPVALVRELKRTAG